MPKKVLLSKFFRIEYILIYISALSLASTLFFKYKESENFENLLIRAERCIQIRNSDSFLLNDEINDLKKSFTTFTYYNEGIGITLDRLVSLIIDKGDSHFNEEINTTLMALQKEMYLNQKDLEFGYGFLLFISFFIILVSICVIIHNSLIQKNELNLTKVLTESQLKFSREIHDGVAQDLAALKMCLENDNSTKAKYFAEQAFNEVRFIIETTHQNLSENFESILNESAKAFETNFNIETELLVASSNIHLISDTKKLNLLRILNEALSNTARHSKATYVTIKITDFKNGFRFIISDNGIGFSENKMPEKVRKHYGIENIKTRVSDLGGTVDFIFEGGTTIAITIEDIIP